MKMRHSQQSEPDVISVFVGTWNMGKLLPPTDRGDDAAGFQFQLSYYVLCLQGDRPLHVLCRPG